MLTDPGKCLSINLQSLNDGIICRVKYLIIDTIFIYLNSHFSLLAMFTVPTFITEMRGCFVHKNYFKKQINEYSEGSDPKWRF